MFKDYYSILGIPENVTPEQIKDAYRTQARKWHPDKNPDRDTTEQMKDINEAYSILSNADTRARYDKEYQFYQYANPKNSSKQTSASEDNDYDIQDDQLKQDIKKARMAAEEYAREFYANMKKDSANAAKGALDGAKPYLIVALVMTLIGILFAAFRSSSSASTEASEPVVQIPDLKQQEESLPEGWTKYSAGSSFQISVPSTVELRGEEDEYSKSLKSLNLTQNDDNIIFQQKGLSRREKTALDQYCRIMIQYLKGSYGDFMKATETETLDSEWKGILDELVEGCIGPAARLMGSYTYKWSTISGAKCIQIDYRRTGNNFDPSIPVVCRIAIFQNNNEMVKLVLSYREKESNIWKDDFVRVFNSFKWI